MTTDEQRILDLFGVSKEEADFVEELAPSTYRHHVLLLSETYEGIQRWLDERNAAIIEEIRRSASGD